MSIRKEEGAERWLDLHYVVLMLRIKAAVCKRHNDHS